jgi:hypothetical protein
LFGFAVWSGGELEIAAGRGQDGISDLHPDIILFSHHKFIN